MSDATGGSSMVRSSNPSHDGGFDLSNEGSALALLRAIHQSPLDLDTKNKLRDTVFAFRAESGAVVTSELEAMFAEQGFSLLGVVESEEMSEELKLEEKVKEKPQSRFGMSRKQPQFSTSVAPSVVKSEPVVQEPVAPASVVQEKSSVISTPEENQGPTPAAEPSAEKKDAVAPIPVTPLPEVESKSDLVAPVAEATKTEEVVTPESAAKPAAASTSAISTSPLTDRIKEIKHEVNEMVGNPVNLIDIHNEVGREYMNALLDAMKKSAGGSGGQDAAMQRLEAAFTAVKETMDIHTRKKDEVVHAEKQESVAPKESVVQPEKTEEVPVPEKSDFAPTSISEEAILKKNAKEKKKEEAKAVPVAEVDTKEVEQPLSSVAKEKQIQQMMLDQKREEATTDQQRKDAEIAAMDPLMTPEVTAGLGQLLSEWSIFKHSGLFGTGPSGADHPLYKKLIPVPMAAVVAGRFEGVTPAIKRSITDYMNGWRYEEGIMHEQGETFEHYLRRVIKHILDKRSSNSPKVKSD